MISPLCGWKPICIFLATLFLTGTAPGQDRRSAGEVAPQGPLSPTESMARAVLQDGLKLELAACEPQVVDPIAIRFDAAGRMWVVEMTDYPHGPAEGELPQSRIRVLEDTDGDGFFEKATTFADQLLFPTGLQPWKNGVIVTLAGEVAWMADTDGDLVADVREPWFRGFAQENSQLRANHPTLGIDGKISIANGLRGGKIVRVGDETSEPLAINGMDFRFDPHTFEMEAITGVGQFGMTFDDFGRRFICSNRNPLMHVVIDHQYVGARSTAVIDKLVHDVSPSGFESRIYPISEFWTTSNLHAGQFTAACGATIYRGDHLAERFYGNAFTCDPTGNLVHRQVLKDDGPTFSASSPYQEVEFLASRDGWFRPVSLRTGPDGALYVVDMYRAVIEHPQFVPSELKNRPDQRFGDDLGRIYRVIDPNQPRLGPRLNFETDNPASWAMHLEHPNGWQRDTAFRLIVENGSQAAVHPATKLLETSPSAPARAMAYALLPPEDDRRRQYRKIAISDPSPGVREIATRLSEQHTDQRDVMDLILDRCEDSDPRVRFRATMALSQMHDNDFFPVGNLSAVAMENLNDPWFRRAVLIAANTWAKDLADRIWKQSMNVENLDQRAMNAMLASLAAQSARLNDETADAIPSRIFDDVADGQGKFDTRLAILNAWVKVRGSLSADQLKSDLPSDRGRLMFDRFHEQARQVVNNDSAATTTRVEAMELLARIRPYDPAPLLALLDRAPDSNLHAAAIRALRFYKNPDFWKAVLNEYSSHSPTVRAAILDSILAQASRIEGLLAAIESGQIKASEIDPTYATRLKRISDSSLRQRAIAALATAVAPDRQQVLQDFQPVLRLDGDPRRGLELFRNTCANCHHVGDVGVDVAPDISDSRVKSVEQLLTDILQPNRAIDANYVSYIVETKDGEVLTGILSTETGNSITLTQSEGKEAVLSRDEIESIESTGLSLMPDGLEKDMSHQDLADIIAYVKGWRYLDGRTPATGFRGDD